MTKVTRTRKTGERSAVPATPLIELQPQAFEIRNTRTLMGVPQSYTVDDFLRVAREFENYSRPYGELFVHVTGVSTESATINSYAALKGFNHDAAVLAGSVLTYKETDASLEATLVIGRLETMKDVSARAFETAKDTADMDKLKDGLKVAGAVVGGALLGGIPLLIGMGYGVTKFIKHADPSERQYCSVILAPKKQVSVEQGNAYAALISQLKGNYGDVLGQVRSTVEAVQQKVAGSQPAQTVREKLEQIRSNSAGYRAQLDEFLKKRGKK